MGIKFFKYNIIVCIQISSEILKIILKIISSVLKGF